MLLRMYQRWAERRGFSVEVDEATEGQEAGLLSATFIVHGRFAYGLVGHRARRAPTRAHVALRLAAPPPDELRLHRRHAVPRGRLRRGGDRREGPAHRHLPLVGRRRPARQQDRLGGAPHAPARPASWWRARTSAASTRTRRRRCRSSGPSWPSGPGPSARPSWTRLSGERVDNAWGNQIRSYVHGAVPAGEGPAHQLRDGQRRRRARRRPRRVHGSRAAAPAGVRRVASARRAACGGRAAGRPALRLADALTCTGAADPNCKSSPLGCSWSRRRALTEFRLRASLGRPSR